MAAFSELCPIFNTGVYGEIQLKGLSPVGSTTVKLWQLPPFGRSVRITGAYCKRNTAMSSTVTAAGLKLYRLATRRMSLSAGTAFASVVMSSTVTLYPLVGWKTVTMVTANKTFSATQILAIGSRKLEANMKTVDLIIRYKEA